MSKFNMDNARKRFDSLQFILIISTLIIVFSIGLVTTVFTGTSFAEINPDEIFEGTVRILTEPDINDIDINFYCPSENYVECCFRGYSQYSDRLNFTVNLSTNDWSITEGIMNVEVNTSTYSTNRLCINSSSSDDSSPTEIYNREWQCNVQAWYDGNYSDIISESIFIDYCDCHTCDTTTECYVSKQIEEMRCINESELGSGEYILVRVKYIVNIDGDDTVSELEGVYLEWNFSIDDSMITLNCTTNSSGWCNLSFPAELGEYEITVDTDSAGLSECDETTVNNSWNFIVDEELMNTCQCNETRDVEIIYSDDMICGGRWDINVLYKGAPAPEGTQLIIFPCPSLPSPPDGMDGVGGYSDTDSSGCILYPEPADSGNFSFLTIPSPPGEEYFLTFSIPSCSFIVTNINCGITPCSEEAEECNATDDCCEGLICSEDGICIEEAECKGLGESGCNESMSCCEYEGMEIDCYNGTCCITAGSGDCSAGPCCPNLECNSTTNLCFLPTSYNETCEDDSDCPSGTECIDGECMEKTDRRGAKNKTELQGIGGILGIDKTCLFGDCSPEAIRRAIEEGLFNWNLVFRNGCAGLFIVVDNWIICDLLWILLIVMAIIATWIWRRRKLKDVDEAEKDTEIKPAYRFIPYITLLLPLIIGFLTYVWIGILIAVLELLIRITGLKEIEKYDETRLYKK